MNINKVFHKFNIDEINVINKKTKLEYLIAKCNTKNINIQFLKSFPPCIISRPVKIHLKDDPLKLDNHNIALTNNLYFGKEYFDLNRLFRGSPFISISCKNCRSYITEECRGLLNKKFLKMKNTIVNKIGKDNYKAVQKDYENGMCVFGSICKGNCRFCFDKLYPEEILKNIPPLNSTEILHFVHYLPKKIWGLGSSYHCKSGDILDSPSLFEILPILDKFMVTRLRVLSTVGRNINQKTINQLRKCHMYVSISVNTLNNYYRKKFMNETKPINCLKKINLLKKNGIPYQVSFVPLKTLVNSGDLLMSISTILKNDATCSIRITPPSSSKFMDLEIIDELNVDYFKLKEDIHKKYPGIYFADDESEILGGDPKEVLINKLINKLKRICLNSKKFLILPPGTTFTQLKMIESRYIKIRKVESLLNISHPTCGVLLIDDYKNTINHEEDIFDYVILPQKSFDINLDDFSLVNVNDLWKTVKNKKAGMILI